MALADTITTDDADGTDVVYNLTGRDLTSSTRRATTGDSNSEPKGLTIKHQPQGKGVAAADRHNVVLYKTFEDSIGVPRTGLVSVTIVQPRAAEFTEQVMKDLTAEAVSLLAGRSFSATTGLGSDSVINALLKGET